MTSAALYARTGGSDVATLYKHPHFAGVRIVTLAEGGISELHVGLKGTMNALFLKDLAAKTHPCHRHNARGHEQNRSSLTIDVIAFDIGVNYLSHIFHPQPSCSGQSTTRHAILRHHYTYS